MYISLEFKLDLDFSFKNGNGNTDFRHCTCTCSSLYTTPTVDNNYCTLTKRIMVAIWYYKCTAKY